MEEQAGSETEQEFVWDGSMEAGLMDELLLGMGGGETCAIPQAGEHVHGPGCGHDHGVPAELADLEASVIEVAHALEERYGETGPTPEQEKEFMREWLLGKGRSEEDVASILAD